jgi:alkyl sulfatase BDS1-like metallo-beta-lactamase superfamily hydrolase
LAARTWSRRCRRRCCSTTSLVVENGVLNHFTKPATDADATLTLSKAALDQMQLKEATPEQKMTSGELKIEGRQEALDEFLGLLDPVPFWFNIVTP